MADWLGIDSSLIDSLCGETGGNTLAKALDGTDYWNHEVKETHWFILDLGEKKTIEKVRGRSLTANDPIDVNVYVSDNKADWGVAVATGIGTFQDTDVWQEVNVTSKEGRYLKVEVINTENVNDFIRFGGFPYFKIFDVYGAVPAVESAARSRCGFRPIEGADRLRGLRSNVLY